MKNMKYFVGWLFFAVAGCTWRETICTCVLESDFGFTLNCAFKKSGLFRVRNLGGVGGYIGLGLSVGDELGFRNSLTNLESSKRRSVQSGKGNFIAIENGGNAIAHRDGIPPFKPLPPGESRPMTTQPEHQRLVVRQNLTALRTIPAPSLMLIHESAIQQQESLMPHSVNVQSKRAQVPQATTITDGTPVYHHTLPNIIANISPIDRMVNVKKISNSIPTTGTFTSDKSSLPAFLAIPQSSTQFTDRISNSPILIEDSLNEVINDDSMQIPLANDQIAQSVNKMTLQSFNPTNTIDTLKYVKPNSDKVSTASAFPLLSPIQGMKMSLKTLAKPINITLDASEAAMFFRHQQLMEKQQGITTTTTTTTTTQSPFKSYTNAATTKVMNAPKEYYPMGYYKNYDDNFTSRVDLPDTRFYCGDQKHFPGLYADEDLGCMVFHVCALTDDGLIMKSFLCPESTLFDQLILKCNWWFYVDCKASKNSYDSNIPISKSYQLMKALAFFSAYKNHDNITATTNVTKDDS